MRTHCILVPGSIPRSRIRLRNRPSNSMEATRHVEPTSKLDNDMVAGEIVISLTPFANNFLVPNKILKQRCF